MECVRACSFRSVTPIRQHHPARQSGSVFRKQIPSCIKPIDCTCLPQDLQTDDDYEAIPLPWTDAVPLLATSFCYNSLQNPNMARYWKEEFDNYVHRYSAAARPARKIYPYPGGRW